MNTSVMETSTQSMSDDQDRVTSWRVIDKAEACRRIDWVARFMDDAITIPGINKKIGYDGLIGLIPVVGDIATCLVSGYIIVESARAGVPKRALAAMIGRLGIDTAIGAIPLLGDFFDFAYKANRRNATTALKHLNK